MKIIGWDIKTHLNLNDEQELVDCQIAEFLLSYGRTVPPQEQVQTSYGIDSLEALATVQEQRLREAPNLYTLFTEIEMPLIPVLKRMEEAGILLDTTALTALGTQVQEEIGNIEEQLQKQIGYKLNLNSSVQIGDYLAEKLGVPLKKTKTGRYATNENEISQYAPQYPFIQDFLTYRELQKLRSTYIESLISKVDESGRIHTTYSQVGANTGRLSSSNPNLQNIPVNSAYGQKIKSCFTPQDGNVFVSFDYSQQELRILAHVAEEEKMIEAFRAGQDIHKTTASQLFRCTYESVTSEQRMIAKTINFGIIYGMSSYGMSSGLNIPVEEAQKFITTFYETYPHIRIYYDDYLRQAKMQGFAQTLLGRRRYVFEFPGQKFIDNAMKRVLMNYPIQGSAADLMKKAMIAIDRDIVVADSACRMLLQIHDDLVFEVPNEETYITNFARRVKKIMCEIYPLSVPVEVDVKVGIRWGEMKKIPLN